MGKNAHTAQRRDRTVAEEGATTRSLAPVRVAQRARTAETLASVLRSLVASGEKGATLRAAAKRAGISHTQLERLCDPLSGRGLLFDLVHALGPKIAAAVLRAELTEVERGRGSLDLRDVVLDVQTHVGRLAERTRAAHADGELTADEIDDIEGAAHATQAAAATALAVCAAARRALR